jgi:hypothetical protein
MGDIMGSDETKIKIKDENSKLSFKDKLNSNKTTILIVTVVVLVLFVGFLALRYSQSQREIKRLSNPQEVSKQETAKVVEAVGKLVELPVGETPTLATVSDVSKLEGQQFFANAKNGDKVLIFTQAKKAVLYRSSTNKIIEVAPVNLGGSNTPAKQ